MNQTTPSSSILVESGDKDQSLLKNCVNLFPTLVYLLDLHREELVVVNDKMSEYLGFTAEDLETFRSNVPAIVHEDDKRIYSDALERVKSLGKDEEYTYVVRLNKKDGGCIYAKTTARMTGNLFGLPHTAFCVVENVTERVKAEEELHAIRHIFDATEKLILFGTWNWVPRLDKTEWTDGMFDLLEYNRDEVAEPNFSFLMKHVVPDHVEALRQAIDNALRDKTDFDTEFVIRTRTGREKVVQCKGKTILDKDGNIRKVLGITRDITHKKNFEKERDRYIRELNRSNKELEEFAYVASHDMHEPLRKILTFSERLKNKYTDSLGDDGRLYIDRIAASAGSMRNLIDNLLEFSRVSRGPRNQVLCDLNQVLADVMADQELNIEETGTRLTVRNLPKVEAVPTEIRQLFNNLVANALKFRKKDVPPAITISAHRVTHKEKSDFLLPFNQPFFRIDIADNGIGFEGIYAEKIFEIFQRLHGKSEYSGSGIGLAICKKIVENHGGLIHATSVSGEGSTFSVILPEKQIH